MTEYDQWRTDRAKVADYLEALAAEIRAGRGPTEIAIDTKEERDLLYRGVGPVATVRRPGFIAREMALEKMAERARYLESANYRLTVEAQALREEAGR